jgi:hypothetical protein
VKKNKQRKRKASVPERATEDVAHLDEALTDITATTAVGLKKHWRPLAVGLGAVALVVLLYVGMQAVERNRQDNIQARFYRLYIAPVALGEEPDSEGIQSLLGEVEGVECEKFMIKQWVGYQLDRADELERERKESAETEEVATSSDAEPRELRDKAVTLAESLAARYPHSQELQDWKKAVVEKVEAMGQTGWLPPSRRYEPPRIPGP